MCRKLIYLVCFVLVLSIAGNASAELVAHWRFDEGSGNVAYDTSGNGHDGTINGAPNWVPGVGGSALEFDGTDDYVGTGESLLDNMSEFTLAFWVSAGNPDGSRIGLVGQNDLVEMGFNGGNAEIWTSAAGTTNTPWTFDNYTWHHFTVVCDATSTNIYFDGELAVTGGGAANYGTSTFPVNIGGGGVWDTSGNWFLGQIDDVRIYNHALSEQEILDAMEGAGEAWPYALGPVPADGALLTEIWVSLGWSPGGSAVSHDVYLGENFDDVNDGTGETFRGNKPLTPTTFFVGFITFPYPDGLVPGTTYYWRIDEVNDLHPDSPWKGDVWSFWIQPRIAYEPIPADGAKFIDPNADLSWMAGLDAKVHYMYFGDNFDDVNSAVEGLLLADTTYTPGTLEFDKTYYWRVDESIDIITMLTGDVWSFKTLPDIPITDPNMVGWWKLDEGTGTTALDWSGHGNHGTLNGDPQWVVGYDGGALEFDGDDHVDTGYTEDLANYTITCWVISPAAPSGAAASGPLHREQNYQFNWNHGDVIFRGAAAMNAGGAWQAASYMPLEANTWYHLAATYDGNVFNAYRNGVLITSNPAPSGPPNAESGTLKLGRHATSVNNYFTGTVDDARVYNKALTLDEIQQTMRGDPLLAGAPNPTNGSTPYIREATPLSWLPGDNASQHDVYFGIDKDAVADANASDTTGVYRVRQVGTSYTPPDVEWGGGPYYWRVDEYNTDATISEGRIWSFTVADFIVIDDFEDYNDFEPDIIFETWMDGWDVDTNGSEVGYAEPDFDAGEHFVETNIVHGGSQSMPYFYDTNFKYSEATYSPTQRDWTEEDVGVLSLWFRGNPAGFVEGPADTYTMRAAGTDIWGAADEFRYAYKQLSGDGEIVAKVVSIGGPGTNEWRKAGVMIRESLDPTSFHAFMAVTPMASHGLGFQYRDEVGDSDSEHGVDNQTAPYWVKLVRQGNQFTGYHSPDGVTWTMKDPSGDEADAMNPVTIPMGTIVYIGLALTSHTSGVTCVAEFSDVETTGAVTPLTWTHEAIGATMTANDPALMYVALNGGTAVYHGNSNAPLIDTWTEWTIDLQDFTGVNLTNVNTIAIGFGDKNNLQAGGTGLVFFDDIRLYRLPEPEQTP